MDSARADWIKLDTLLWIGPQKDVPYLPIVGVEDDAAFDVPVGWSAVTMDFFFFWMSGSKSVEKKSVHVQ